MAGHVTGHVTDHVTDVGGTLYTVFFQVLATFCFKSTMQFSFDLGNLFEIKGQLDHNSHVHSMCTMQP